MKFHTLGYILILLLFTAGCNTSTSYLVKDFQESKALKRIIYSEEGEQVLHITKNSPNPKKDLNYYWYRNQTLHSTVGNYSGLLANGVYEKFDDNKNLITKGNYRNGLRDNKWQEWYPSGTISKAYNYNKNGRLSGVYREYGKTGNIISVGKYTNGIKKGKWLENNALVTYKRGEIYIVDSTRKTFIRRLLSKPKSKKNSTQTIDSTASFFKRLFRKNQ